MPESDTALWLGVSGAITAVAIVAGIAIGWFLFSSGSKAPFASPAIPIQPPPTKKEPNNEALSWWDEDGFHEFKWTSNAQEINAP